MTPFSPKTAALMAPNQALYGRLSTPFQTRLLTLCLGLCVIFLTACGQKGALYLPDPAHQPNVAVSNTVATTEQPEQGTVMPEPAQPEQTQTTKPDPNIASTHQ